MENSIQSCVRYFESRVSNEILKAHQTPTDDEIVMSDYAEKLVNKHEEKVQQILLRMKKGNKDAPLVLTNYANQLLIKKAKSKS